MYYNLEDGVKYTEPTWKFIIGKGLNNESEINAPLYQQAFRWFDENSEYQGFVIGSIKENAFDWEIREDGNVVIECDQYYTTREEAQDACLRKLIEYVQSKKRN